MKIRFSARGCKQPALSWVPSPLGLTIAVDDFDEAEFWAQIVIPLDDLRALVRLCELKATSDVDAAWFEAAPEPTPPAEGGDK